MNLIMIVINDDNQSDFLWKVLDDYGLFSNSLAFKPLVLSLEHFKSIPKKQPIRRYLIIDENMENDGSQVLIFKDNKSLLERLKLVTEDFYMIPDQSMFNFFLKYIKILYYIEDKNLTSELEIDSFNFSKKVVIDNQNYRIIEYKKV